MVQCVKRYAKLLNKLELFDANISSAWFSADGMLVAAIADNSILLIWDVESGQVVKRFYRHNTPARLLFGPDSRFLLLNTQPRGDIEIFRLDDTLTNPVIIRNAGDFFSFLPNGDKFIACKEVGLDKWLYVYYLDDPGIGGTPVYRFRAADPVRFSCSGTNVLFCSSNRLYDVCLVTKTTTPILSLHEGETILDVITSRDRARILVKIATTHETLLRDYDACTREILFQKEYARVSSCRFVWTPDADTILSIYTTQGRDGAYIYINDLLNDDENIVIGPTDWRWGYIEFSPCRSKLLVGAWNGVVTIWELGN